MPTNKKRKSYEVQLLACCQSCIYSGVHPHEYDLWCMKNRSQKHWFDVEPLGICEYYEEVAQ